MTTEHAIKVLETICAKYIGNLAEHRDIQEALSIVKAVIVSQKENKQDN